MKSEIEPNGNLANLQCYQILQGNARNRCIPPGNNDSPIARDANGVLYAFAHSKEEVTPWHPVGNALPQEEAQKVLEDNLNSIRAQEVRSGRLTCCR